MGGQPAIGQQALDLAEDQVDHAIQQMAQFRDRMQKRIGELQQGGLDVFDQRYQPVAGSAKPMVRPTLHDSPTTWKGSRKASSAFSLVSRSRQ